MEGGSTSSIELAKRSDTAELRRRFDAIADLLAEGYNHKQICEHLNTQGLAIPYPQYRAIMTRLRRERATTGNAASQAVMPSMPLNLKNATLVSNVPLLGSDGPRIPDPQRESDKQVKFSWDPSSEIKWK